MSTLPFNIKKWTVRCLLAIGALLGFSSCFHTKSTSSAECVYGPPEMFEQSSEPMDSPQNNVEPVDSPKLNDQEVEPVKVVYGPRPYFDKDAKPAKNDSAN